MKRASTFSVICSLFTNLPKSDRGYLNACIFIATFSCLLEVVAIGAILKYINFLLGSPSKIASSGNTISLFGLENITIPQASSILLLLACFSALIRSLSLYCNFKFAADYAHRITTAAYNRIINQSLSVLTSINSSDLISALTSDSFYASNCIAEAMNFATNLLAVFVFCGILLFYSPSTLVWCTIIFVPVGIIVSRQSRSAIISNSRIANQSGIRLLRDVRETIDGIRDIIICQNYDKSSTHFSNIDYKIKCLQAKNKFAASFPKFILELTAILFVVIYTSYLILTTDSPERVVNTLGLLVFCALKILPLVQQLNASISGIRAAEPSYTRILEIFKPSIGSIPDVRSSESISFRTNELAIEFRGVVHQYPHSGDLHSSPVCISCFLSPKSIIGVVGPSGSGKSTFLDLLSGLVAPSSGVILVNGIDLNTIIQSKPSRLQWFKSIGYCPQSVTYYDNTILHNISLETEAVDQRRLSKALHASQLLPVVADLDLGLQTTIGEDGCLLSGGQLQRIGLARALYREPSLLIMDEATSALDVRLEEKVLSSIARMYNNIMIVMVTHRMDSLKHCDIVLNFDGGMCSTDAN
jgi:ABC-type multidrug transport system fused ATPase/permease subunit